MAGARIASLSQLGAGAWKLAGRPPAAPKPPPIAPPPTIERAPRKPRKNEIEGAEQALLIKEFRLRFPRYARKLIHIPNGGSRKNAFEGWRLKEQGVRAGVSDLLLPMARGGYFGLWIEFKAAPPNNAPVSDDQQAWLQEMRDEGYRAEACLGIDAALAVLTDYLAQPPIPAKT